MPELPEVETIRKDLKKVLLNEKINEIVVNNPKVIKEPSLKKFNQLLIKSRVIDIFRRGKLLVLGIEKSGEKYFFAIHLRMSGQIIYGQKNIKSRVSFKLSNNKWLNYNDQRLLGVLRVVRDWQNLSVIKKMGPEPLGKEFTQSEFKQRVSKRKGKIKSLLLDQTFVAGIGNIYAAESLFLSGINPQRRADTLRDNEIKKLFDSIRKVLAEAIKYRGTSFSMYRDGHGEGGKFLNRLFVYGRKGKSCLKCKTPVRRIVLAGRGTYFCEKCQS
ncbi:MAG: bifunctional DNA-formamidopyrimidine glycosylase/DNA-(apurinic or apyrimidinic site) lyase [PVC group bacterium]|nr:bifunctional DNA-formamidopyrimidine glycosylase/DNA-(apurinic or apyrimidinic site) lyase [PVC group bacterium]